MIWAAKAESRLWAALKFLMAGKREVMLKHITIGLLVPFCIFIFYYIRNGWKINSDILSKMPLIFLGCMLWSFVPSIVNGLPLGFVKEIVCDFYISNIFFFYGILNRLNRTGSTFGLAMILVIFFTMIIIFAHHLKIQEREIDHLRKGKK
ncbi:MAG: hypothetical protein PHW46_01555 [Candidatus Omnitrophica bacterium]|nr:hypothetical protein [Candidatus Omnitrophota bacterium]